MSDPERIPVRIQPRPKVLGPDGKPAPPVNLATLAPAQIPSPTPPLAYTRAARGKNGPGTELKALLATLGLGACLGCAARAQQMDEWGAEGCRQRRAEIVGWLRAAKDAVSWWTRIKAGTLAVTTGLAFQLDMSDPFGYIVDEAIRRAEAKLPLQGPVRRNLLYHIYPAKNRWWRWNVEQLLSRISLFNGRRIVACMTAPNLDPPDMVREAFGNAIKDEDFLVLKNIPHLCEVVSFEPLFSRVESTDPNEVTFRAHAKGVTRPSEGEASHDWAKLMYAACLDYWPVVEGILKKYPVAGCFKKKGHYFPESRSDWHYAGSFYWLRHHDLFTNPQWRLIDQFRFGIEPYPSLHFPVEEAGTIFWEGVGFTVYDWKFLHDQVWPAFEQWKASHANERTVIGANL